MQVVESNGEDANGDIDRRNELFNIVAAEFSIDLGKAESRRERSEKGFKEISLTYGEIEFKSFFQAFKWI